MYRIPSARNSRIKTAVGIRALENNMRFFIFTSLIFCGGAIVSILSQSTPQNHQRDEKFESSEAVLVGKVVSMAFVARKDRLVFSDPKKRVSSNPNDYVLANEIEMEVSTWIKSDTKTRKRKPVRILIPGYGYPRHNDPILIVGKEYLVFLNKAKLGEKYQDAIVLRSKTGFTSLENIFDPLDYFTVNGGEYGAIGDQQRIKEYVKQSLGPS